MLNFKETDSIRNKIVIVTGANCGIGFEIAKMMVLYGAKVVIACRNESKGLKTQAAINGNCEYINLDLGSFESIDRFTNLMKSRYPKVDILINNAGVMWPPFIKTNEQLELTFGINYIGHYLLTNKIMPLLRDVMGSRVVNMTSISQYRVHDIDWDNINSEKHYSKTTSYNQSNLFRMMFTLELEEKLRSKNYETMSISCHPGVTITNLVRFMPKILSNPIFVKSMNKLFFHTPDKAAMTALVASTNSDIKGGDLVGLNTKKQHKGIPKVVLPNSLAFDRNLRKTLWERSVQITGSDLE